MPRQEILYRDLDFEFIPNPVTGDVSPVMDDVAVKRSVKNLVLTNFYERPFQPNLGSSVSASLFENIDRMTAKILQDRIKTVLIKYEPRAQDLTVDIEADYDNNRYVANITFSIGNMLEPQLVIIFLERVR